MEVIPRSLAENAGMDPIDVMVGLRAAHDQNKISHGVLVEKGGIGDAESIGVVEPLKVKTQAIKSAAEAAEMILRIDDVISATGLSKGGAGMPPGMPGMPPGGMPQF